ncbi:MAG: alanine/glycine:cation symporter family protein [Bacilli bacterium]|nr:alanine/glycine:cation symporter family protein [Bacilli bacterium]
MDILNKVLWAGATVLIVYAGIYFTWKLRFVQFHFKQMAKSLFTKAEKGIKPYQTLMMVLAGRIGVGSIAGVALAIYLGGVGSIFWMWIIAFIGAANSFAETVLGILYKEKDGKDIYKGGPSYYLKNGLGYGKLGAIYAFIIIISYIFGFLGIQANTITKSIGEIVNISPIIVGIVIVFFTFITIFGGIKTIASTASKLVPFMTIGYIGIALYICFLHIDMIPTIFGTILKEAFTFKPFVGGFLGTFIIGVQRGIFSNEAGLGTGAIASSTVATNDSCSQGYLQMIGVYITTMLICTSTAVIILTSPYQNLVLNDINGIEITQFAFKYHLGDIGSYMIFFSIILFSFSTILTGYYDGESSLKYFLKKVSKGHLFLLKGITLAVLFMGCLLPSNFLWNLVDIMVAILAFINIYALLKLKQDIVRELKEYHQKRRKGKENMVR